MRKIGVILIIIGFLFGILGVVSFWRDNSFKKASTASKAIVDSVDIKPIRDGLSNIFYYLVYMRDGSMDTREHQITTEYTIKNPIPSVEELKSTIFYVHYVPSANKERTYFPERVYVNNSPEYEGLYKEALFGQMLTLILLGIMVRLFFRRVSRG